MEAVMWMFTCFVAQAADLTALEVEAGRPSHGLVAGIVDLPIGAVLDRVVDCEGSAAWFPDVLDTEVVSDEDGVVRCAGKTDLPWPLADRTWQIDTTVERTARGYVVPFVFVHGSGNLDELHGHYVLEDLGDGRTRVAYEAWVDLGFWVPDLLVDWATRRVLPAILSGMESYEPPGELLARR